MQFQTIFQIADGLTLLAAIRWPSNRACYWLNISLRTHHISEREAHSLDDPLLWSAPPLTDLGCNILSISLKRWTITGDLTWWSLSPWLFYNHNQREYSKPQHNPPLCATPICAICQIPHACLRLRNHLLGWGPYAISNMQYARYSFSVNCPTQ